MGEGESGGHARASEGQRPTHRGGEKRKYHTTAAAHRHQQVITVVDFADVCPERHSPSRETGSPDTAEAAGVPEQSSTGADISSSETDRVSTGEQHQATDTERQATGQSRSPHTVECALYDFGLDVTNLEDSYNPRLI